MARCWWPDSQKSYIAVEKRLAAVAKQNGGPIQHIFCWSVDNINDELLANIVLWRAILFRLYHG